MAKSKTRALSLKTCRAGWPADSPAALLLVPVVLYAAYLGQNAEFRVVEVT